MDLASKDSRSLDVDLIITTIPLDIADVPVVLVNRLLGDGDKLKIRETLGLDNLKPSAGERMEFVKGRSLASLLSEETIQYQVPVKNWEEAVSSSCLPLLQNGAIEERYVGAIKDLLKQHGPYMVIATGVVLLHAMTGFGVKKVCMSLTTFSSPVKFGHLFNDPVSLAIVFGATDNHSHLKALIQLSKLLGDQSLMNDLKSAPSREELISLLYRAIQIIH
jgi:mannitol/fructose-specific phosphotransferase system IIA component (Ntr-type)